MKTEMSVEIARPIDEVFDYTNNRISEWSDTVVSDEVIEQKEGDVGTTFRIVTEETGKEMAFQGVVTRYDPPNASAVHLTGDFFDIDAEYFFDDLSDRTRVTQRSTVTGKGLTKVMFVLFGWLMKRSGCKAQESELNNLKRLLENGAGQTA